MICTLLHFEQCDVFVLSSSALIVSSSHEVFYSLDKLLLLIKCSLRLGKCVYITNSYPLEFPLLNLEPKRLWIEKEKFIFCSPRAGYFFTDDVIKTQISSYSKLEQITQAWGK